MPNAITKKTPDKNKNNPMDTLTLSKNCDLSADLCINHATPIINMECSKLMKRKNVSEELVNRGATNRSKGKMQIEHKNTIPIILVTLAIIILGLKLLANLTGFISLSSQSVLLSCVCHQQFIEAFHSDILIAPLRYS